MLENASFGGMEWVSPGKYRLWRDLNDEKEQARPGSVGRPQRAQLVEAGRVWCVRDTARSQSGWGTKGERGEDRRWVF